MKYINKIIVINFFCILIIGYSFADERTAFINVDYIIQNSNIGKRVLSKINKQNEENIEKLEKKNKTLKDLESEIKSKKNIISEDDFKNEVISFQNKIQKFNNEKNVIVSNFNNLRKKEIENVFKTLKPVINDFMKENSIVILLDTKNIFMGSPEINFTNDVLKKINNEIK